MSATSVHPAPYGAGSWTYSGRVTEENVGLTAMATTTFLNYGVTESDPAVDKAIDWILSKQRGDGCITNGSNETYDTSLALLALRATTTTKCRLP
jgi:squalene cyclase